MVGWSILSWIVAGLIVGALARFIVPGRQDLSIAMTIVLGIIGALVGGFLASVFFGPALDAGMTTFDLNAMWPGWLLAIAGGVGVLWIAVATTRRRI
jgi:uncharacterized membrane protein YeaQ/YmgE (transglycosylase-associated protein family)